MDNFAAAFREEAVELIAGLEIALLELEQKPDDREAVDTTFRALHTLKGSGAMFGFDAVAGFTHEVESAFDLVRSGKLRITRDLINITLAARDHIKSLLEGEEVSGQEILARLAKLVAAGGGAAAVEEVSENRELTWHVRYTPSADCLLNGANPLSLLAELETLGTCMTHAVTARLPGLRELDPELCYVEWNATLTTRGGEQAIRDIFIFAGIDEVELHLANNPDDPAEHGIREVQADGGAAEADKWVAAPPDHPRPRLLDPSQAREMRDRPETPESASTIRVPAGKLDSLANIVGELVTVQARLTRIAGASGDPEVVFVAEEVERLTGKLRDTAMSIRMLPVGTAFNRFRRVVRDLSRDLGKEVELIAEGGETELDKTVIERLQDPLVHIIRNSMDHGIEPPEIRVAAGKPRVGKIRLSADHCGTSVLIRIADDGAGLNTAAIRERAIERGLISSAAALSDDQIHALILEPGFSTAPAVTDLSGRGVGMDVVRRAVEALRGSLQMTSAPGKGMVITLRLPLTLAIIDGLLVEAGGGSYVLPLSSILECIEMGPAERQLHGGNLVVVRNEPVGCIRLRDVFGAPGTAPLLEQVVIAETPEGKFGFVVDLVVGDHQTVIKPLSGFYRHVQFISGATILGDGGIALILDVDKLAALALSDRRKAA